MQRQRILSLSILFLLSIPIFLNYAQPTPESAAVTAVTENLSGLPWLEMNEVTLTEMEETDDPVLEVSYISTEFDMVAYRAEMLEVFRHVGTSDMEDAPEMITLIPMVDMGFGIQGVEAATVATATLSEFAEGDMTRTDFLDELDLVPLEHSDSEGADRSPA